jgi:hypothetical protein
LDINHMPGLAQALKASVGNFFSYKDACHKRDSLPPREVQAKLFTESKRNRQ